MENVKNTVEKNCCGCGACAQICPKKCIKMVENNRGFYIPVVDEEKCTKCGLCTKVCPEKNNIEKSRVLEAYAAISKDRSKQINSTSGGVFGLLAEYVLDNNGAVVGAVWENANYVSHIVINNIKELEKLRQSKYVQSDIKNTYKETKEILNESKLVIFSGTGCQIAGLRSFLGKKYNNLITIEVACHGVPSSGLFKRYIEWLEKKEKSQVVEYTFRNRDKHTTGEHYMPRAKFKNGKIKYYAIEKDPYYSAFLGGVTLRQTCYNCKYKNEDRISDITLSDFWGIEKELKDFPAKYGASAVLINTEIGKKIFEKIKDNIIYMPCDKDDVYRHNKSMVQSCKRSKKQFETLNTEDEILFNGLKNKMTVKGYIKFSIKHMIPGNLKYKLKRISFRKRGEK